MAIPNPDLYWDFTTGSLVSLTGALTMVHTRASVALGMGPDQKFIEFATDAPRFVYTYDTQASDGIVVEGARTNLLLYSCAPTTSPWVVSADLDVTASLESVIDGQTAIEFVDSATPVATADVKQQFSASMADAQAYVFSVLIERVGGSAGFTIDLVNTTDAAVRKSLTGTWAASSTTSARVIVLGTGPNGGTLVRAKIAILTTAADVGDVGTAHIYPTGKAATATGEGLILHHAQVEQSVTASSPIVTTSATVTRAVDICVATDTGNVYCASNGEGGWYARARTGQFFDWSVTGSQDPGVARLLSGAGDNDMITLAEQVNQSTSLWCRTINQAGTGLQCNVAGGIQPIEGVQFRYAIRLVLDDAAAACNGTLSGTDVDWDAPSLNNPGIRIGEGGAATVHKIGGAVQELAFWKTSTLVLDSATLDGLSDGTIPPYTAPVAGAGRFRAGYGHLNHGYAWR